MNEFPKGTVVRVPGEGDVLWMVIECATPTMRRIARRNVPDRRLLPCDELIAVEGAEAAAFVRASLSADLQSLVDRFAAALGQKLLAAELIHGWDEAWSKPDWHHVLTGELLKHVGKGDPRDVAAYCAFAWHHGWSVTPDSVDVGLLVGAMIKSGKGAV